MYGRGRRWGGSSRPNTHLTQIIINLNPFQSEIIPNDSADVPDTDPVKVGAVSPPEEEAQGFAMLQNSSLV